MNIQTIYGKVSPWFRRKRMARFRRTFPLGDHDRVLDIGGYPWAWDPAYKPTDITMVNLEFPPEAWAQSAGFKLVVGDGCSLPFPDGSFDLVFSNSVIEHVGNWENQLRMAAEARRLGRRLWVQTPAYEFPIEPHLLALFVHWMPIKWRRRLIRNFTGWGWLTRPDKAAVEGFLGEVRLLRRQEMQLLFPDCQIIEEKFLGLTKSYTAVRSE